MGDEAANKVKRTKGFPHFLKNDSIGTRVLCYTSKTYIFLEGGFSVDTTIAFIVSVLMWGISIVIAVVAIWIGKAAERETRASYEKLIESLAVIGSTISENQKQLLDTQIGVLSELKVIQEEDFDQRVTIMLLQALIDDPKKFRKIMAELQSLAERNQRNN